MGRPKVHSLTNTWQRRGSKRLARAIRLCLIITRDDPNLALAQSTGDQGVEEKRPLLAEEAGIGYAE